MATLLAPYNTAMRLGAGFNSYTQQLCLDDAVIREDPDSTVNQQAAVDNTKPPVSKTTGADHAYVEDEAADKQEFLVAQAVTYKTCVIDKVTDVTNAMNINAAFSIKNDTLDAKGKGNFIDASKVKESDISFMITVKVVNQVLCDHSLTRFNPVSEVNAEHFTSVYGDCFISGFQEGGEFIAIISVKAKDSEQASKIKANAAVKFTKEHLALDAKGNFGKSKDNFLDENETTVSVTWTGGGQDLKKPTEDWSLETMRTAALKFPNLVATTPTRTHAILKKYTALRGFYEASGFSSLPVIPNYEQAGLYTNALHEDYLEYKALFKNLHTLALDVSAGNKTLSASPATARLKGQEKSKAAVSSEALGSAPTPSSPYESSIVGLEKARRPSPNLPPLTITPPTSTTPIPITLEQADILTTPLPTLTQILANYHTIITCTGFALPAGTQLRLARAVLAAHAARYFPWQFGLDYPTVGAGSAQALFDEQLQVRGLLAAQSATDWTVLSTGVFMEFLVDPAAGFGVLELDDPARKVTALGGWERRVSMTATEDVGRMVAEVVFAPLGEGERTGFVAGDTLSWEGVKEVVGRVFGEGEVEGEVLGDEELERRVREGGGGLDRYRAVFGRGVGTAWEREETVNYQRGVRLLDFETFLQRWKEERK